MAVQTDVKPQIESVFSFANTLRGVYQPDKYKDVIIPMVIIRRLECALEPTRDRVCDAYEKNPNTPPVVLERIAGENMKFYNTCRYRLKTLLGTPASLKLLSRIIDDWNMRYSIHGNKHQLKGIVDALEGSLADDARVRRSAEANGLGDFKTTLNDRTVDTLAENYDGTNELYNVLLSHEDARRELVDIIAEGIYRGLRQGD